MKATKHTVTIRLCVFALTSLIFNGLSAQTGDTVDMYYYKNSLYNHLETGNSEATASTNVGNWIARFTETTNNPKVATLGSVFGFFPQWSVPPKAHNFHSEISTPHMQKWTASWDGVKEIDLLGFVPDNFDGQAFDPSDTTNMGQAYVTKLLYLIDEWATNAPNASRRYVVYAGWPALNRYGGTNDDPSTLTATAIANWHTYGLGDYQDWMELLVTQLQAARPNLDIRLHNISKAVLMCHQNTAVKNIRPELLFEDLAPHGRSTWYFMAAVAEYIEVFGEKPPTNFEFKAEWGVDSTVTSNYQTIVDYIWMVTKGSVSIEPLNVYGQDQLLLYPNPAVSTVQIQTNLVEFNLAIFDAMGRSVVNQKDKKTIDTRDLTTGTYYVELIGKTKRQHAVLLVE